MDHHKTLGHWGKREHLTSFQTEDYILMTVSLLAGSNTVPGTKINVCNMSGFLTNFIPQNTRSEKLLNIGPLSLLSYEVILFRLSIWS